MPVLAFMGLKNGNSTKIAEFRWPTGREIPSSIRKLTIPEFASALELAATMIDTLKDTSKDTPNDTLNPLVEENLRLRKYIDDINSKIETKLETQMNEHTELLLSNHLLLKSFLSNETKEEVKTALVKIPEGVKSKTPFKENRWQTYVRELREGSGLTMKEAMKRAKETYKKDLS
jgi:hypothetical protein